MDAVIVRKWKLTFLEDKDSMKVLQSHLYTKLNQESKREGRVLYTCISTIVKPSLHACNVLIHVHVHVVRTA